MDWKQLCGNEGLRPLDRGPRMCKDPVAGKSCTRESMKPLRPVWVSEELEGKDGEGRRHKAVGKHGRHCRVIVEHVCRQGRKSI